MSKKYDKLCKKELIEIFKNERKIIEGQKELDKEIERFDQIQEINEEKEKQIEKLHEIIREDLDRIENIKSEIKRNNEECTRIEIGILNMSEIYARLSELHKLKAEKIRKAKVGVIKNE